jgi:hypothetical protein
VSGVRCDCDEVVAVLVSQCAGMLEHVALPGPGEALDPDGAVSGVSPRLAVIRRISLLVASAFVRRRYGRAPVNRRRPGPPGYRLGNPGFLNGGVYGTRSLLSIFDPSDGGTRLSPNSAATQKTSGSTPVPVEQHVFHANPRRDWRAGGDGSKFTPTTLVAEIMEAPEDRDAKEGSMASALLFRAKYSGKGSAYEVETDTDPDEWGPTTDIWAHFESVRGFDEDRWRFTWQSKAERIQLLAQSAQRGDYEVDHIAKVPEMAYYIRLIGEAYRRRSDVDDDAPDAQLAEKIIWSLVDGEVNPTTPDTDYGIYSFGRGEDPAFEALRSLPLPKWARISDTRNRGGRLLLVLPPRHSMSDVKYYLEHRRDSYRVKQLKRVGGLRRVLESLQSKKKQGKTRGSAKAQQQ